MNKIISSLLVIFLFGNSCHQKTIPNKDTDAAAVIDRVTKDRIDATLKGFVDSGKVVGISALIFEKNKEV